MRVVMIDENTDFEKLFCNDVDVEELHHIIESVVTQKRPEEHREEVDNG